jgi:phosphate transport system protein
MREVFKQELGDVQSRLVELARLVEVAITRATEAFENSDLNLAEQVIEDDVFIDELAISLDELSIQILARQQPVARDLRTVVGALRMSASLERMGDMADHIAQLTRYRFPEKAIAKGLRGTFKKMGENDVLIIAKLITLLETQNIDMLDEIRDIDDIIDGLHQRVFDKVLGETWQGDIGDTVDATLASRYHERFADHAVSIAKKVKYLATGDWAPAD